MREWLRPGRRRVVVAVDLGVGVGADLLAQVQHRVEVRLHVEHDALPLRHRRARRQSRARRCARRSRCWRSLAARRARSPCPASAGSAPRTCRAAATAPPGDAARAPRPAPPPTLPAHVAATQAPPPAAAFTTSTYGPAASGQARRTACGSVGRVVARAVCPARRAAARRGRARRRRRPRRWSCTRRRQIERDAGLAPLGERALVDRPDLREAHARRARCAPRRSAARVRRPAPGAQAMSEGHSRARERRATRMRR